MGITTLMAPRTPRPHQHLGIPTPSSTRGITPRSVPSRPITSHHVPSGAATLPVVPAGPSTPHHGLEEPGWCRGHPRPTSTPPAAGPGRPLTHHKDDLVVLELFWGKERKKLNKPKSQKDTVGRAVPSSRAEPHSTGTDPCPPRDGERPRVPLVPVTWAVRDIGAGRARAQRPHGASALGLSPGAATLWCPADTRCPQPRGGDLRGSPGWPHPSPWPHPGPARGTLGTARVPQVPGVTPGSP